MVCRSNVDFKDKKRLIGMLNRTQLLYTAAIALSIAGGGMRSPGNTPKNQSTGRKLTRVATILITVTFAALVGYTVYFWVQKGRLRPARLMLLRAFSLAIPFLIVRIVYALLAAFSSALISKWSAIYGSWVAFLVMGLIMEFIVVAIYVTAGILIPYSRDHQEEAK
ncbi:hypothetical protein FGG08_007100 [Glutinoglossum americanum]|uniref:DUF7702 domain-containing protein n=1 Tax=Glutinoglossum americanum TaxID=1670608 RepID=A0A9P8HRF6_9PEZI|nr:hypothetical protein FGG08_007100 [Glutinoglossum americanum]